MVGTSTSGNGESSRRSSPEHAVGAAGDAGAGGNIFVVPPTTEEEEIKVVDVDEESVELGVSPEWDGVADEEVADSGSNLGVARLSSSFRFGRSRVTEEALDGYVTDGLFSAAVRLACRARGREEVPTPESYEAVVFRDFFSTRLCFPCEGFVCEVLKRFNLQIHQLTPNAFSRLGDSVMSLKMAGRIVASPQLPFAKGLAKGNY